MKCFPTTLSYYAGKWLSRYILYVKIIFKIDHDAQKIK
jgi:hypothetical protein